MNDSSFSKTTTIARFIVRVLIGLLFIVSATLKLFSLDTFELYIYSFNIFGYGFSAFVARLVIATELFTGALLILKLKYRWAWWLAILMLSGFSLLLIYVIAFRNDSNCHCMGDIVELKPAASLIKNIITIALLLFIKNENDYEIKWKHLIVGIIAVLSLVIPLALFPMDNLYNLIFTKEKTFDEASFNAFSQDSVVVNTIDLDSGNHIIGILSAGCEFCKISGIKISEMVDNNNLNKEKIVFFIWGEENAINQFKEESKTTDFKYIPIDPILAVRMAHGAFPLYLYVSDGEVVKVAGLRQLYEKDVIHHLQ